MPGFLKAWSETPRLLPLFLNPPTPTHRGALLKVRAPRVQTFSFYLTEPIDVLPLLPSIETLIVTYVEGEKGS